MNDLEGGTPAFIFEPSHEPFNITDYYFIPTSFSHYGFVVGFGLPDLAGGELIEG